MLQFKNATPFEATITLLPDRDGIDTLYTIVKATFTIGPRVTVADEQVPVAMADKHHGDTASSSTSVPSDVCLGKPATDVLLIGTACSPGGFPTAQMDVSLTVGPVSKTVRVFGDRTWDRGLMGARMTPPARFERMPLVWERAFGGTDETPKGPRAEVRNPVGKGFRAPKGTRPLAGLPLPNLEDPSSLISSPNQAPAPAGFAPIAPHWQPRLSYAGTYDEAWQKGRAPYLPADFDPRFFQLAPPGLVTPGYLQGGEPVALRGVTPDGWLQFRLPTVRIQVIYRLGNSTQERPTTLDTVVIEPDTARLVMVWRAALPCDKQALKVKEVHAALREAA